MRLTRTVASLAAGTLLAGAALAAAAVPAFANDEDPLLPGGILWFNTVGPLSAQSAATQITSGENAASGGNLGTGRPWATITTENTCPAGTALLINYIRIPQTGVPENDWDQIQVGAAISTTDADGRFYSTRVQEADRLNKPEIMTYLAGRPGNTGVLPFLSVCKDADGGTTGHFKVPITMTGTTQQNLQWSIPLTAIPGGGGPVVADTTTTLTGAASGADLVLTATVAPAAAAGTVTFKEGSTTLGSAAVSGGTASYTVTAPAQGTRTFTAEFAPTDAAAYKPSSGTYSVTIGLDAATGQIVLTVPGAPVVDGSLTFAVPFATPVQLAGSRSGDNSRVTASGAFPTVTVTDTRRDGLLKDWQVNAQASDFTGTAGTIGAKYLGWAPSSSATPEAGSPLVTRNGATVVSNLDNAASAGLSVSSVLGESATAGRGVATLNATLNLAIPGATPEGTYTSTVTVTLISD
ncbi:MAG TPA: Ig-like domain repeat protein [Actinotalea sp.]|nr:Ig-like domain repeat protein [Actinotalea sp.]